MALLEFKIFNQTLGINRKALVSDSIDYIDANFDFRTEDWNGLSKWAHFINGENVYDVNLVDDRISRDMHLNLSAGIWKVKLHGTDSDGTLRITTNTAAIVVECYGPMIEGAPLPEIPLSAAEQIDAKSQLSLDTANRVMKMAEDGEFNPVRGEDYWTQEDQEKLLEEAVELVKEIPKGDDGKSAYQYAVEGGYTGTEEEFYEDLALSDERFEKIESDIADLKYFPIEILSFTHNAGTKENGDKINSLVLSYELNKLAQKCYLDGIERPTAGEFLKGSFAINSNQNTGASIANATRTFSLEVTDERGAAATKSTTVFFYDGIYYGTAAKPDEVDSEFILSLTKILSGNKNRTVNVSGGEGLYFFYAYPASLGTSIFNIGGFDYEFASEIVSFENKFGVIKDYIVYVSDNPMLSNNNVTVKEG